MSRTLSSFPLSIGTGMALETLYEPTEEVYDPDRIVPDKSDPSRYDTILVNVSTLVRNILSSYPKEEMTKVNNKTILDDLVSELEFLIGFIPSIQLYTNSYKYVIKTYKDKIRLANTDIQLRDKMLSDYAIANIPSSFNLLKLDKHVTTGKKDNCLIVTHIPWDLLWYNSFRSLELLESHTGIIKPRSQWNTKYYPMPNTDTSFLPFMEYILVKLGDRVMFKPDPIQDRIDLVDQLRRRGLHPLSSEFSF